MARPVHVGVRDSVEVFKRSIGRADLYLTIKIYREVMSASIYSYAQTNNHPSHEAYSCVAEVKFGTERIDKIIIATSSTKSVYPSEMESGSFANTAGS
eukprot:scaffold1284_cov108-Cylindrotheca_fusiformis.AAC.7